MVLLQKARITIMKDNNGSNEGTPSEKRRSRRMTNMGMAAYITERDSSMSIPTFFLRFKGQIDSDRLIKLMNDRFLRFERFRSRVEGTDFIELDEFDCEMCTQIERLPEPQNTDSLRKYISGIVNIGMDHSKPLWEAHIIHGIDGEDTAVVFRVHHCIADGMSLGVVLMSLSDEYTAGALSPKTSDNSNGSFKNEKKMLKLFSRTEPSTILKGKLGVEKNVAWISDLKVTHGKAIGKSVSKKGATINDVVLGAIAGGLGKYISSQGHSAEGVNITCVIPVNLRKAGEEITTLGNKFGFLTCQVPLYPFNNPLDRVRETAKRMTEAKKLPESNMAYLMSKGTSYLSRSALNQAFDAATSKVTVAISNVKGPPQHIHFLGKEASDMSGFLPPPPGVGIGFAIASYGDDLTVSVNCDSNICPNAVELLSYVRQEWNDLYQAANETKQSNNSEGNKKDN